MSDMFIILDTLFVVTAKFISLIGCTRNARLNG